MALSFISYSQNGAANGTSSTISKPTGTQDGDIMFIFLSLGSSKTVTSVPTGWTNILSKTSGYITHHIYYKIASSEGTDYTFSFSGFSNEHLTTISTFRGDYDSSGTIIDYSSVEKGGSTEGNFVIPSFNIPISNSVIITLASTFASSSTTFSPPTSPGIFTEHFDYGSATPDFWQQVCSYQWASSGNTGNITVVASSSVYDAIGVAIAIKMKSISNTSNFFQLF